MAKADWLNVSPASGSGNATVNVSSGAAHTGRTARTTTLTFRASSVADKIVTVNQAGKPEFVTIDTAASSAKAGGTVTISGTSNSSKLTFSLGTGTLSISLPSSYTANSVNTNNAASITGDPGATMQYNYSIAFSVPVNTGVTELTKQVIVTDNAGNTSSCLLTQAAGDPSLSVTPTTIELTYEGTAKSITVTSNTSWTAI